MDPESDVLSTMPEDILREIFSKLDKDLTIAKTNVQFKGVAESGAFKLFKLRRRLEEYGGNLDNVKEIDLDTLLTLSEYFDRSTNSPFTIPHLILEFAAYAVFGLNDKFLSLDGKMIEAEEKNLFTDVESVADDVSTIKSDILTRDLIQVLVGLDALDLLNVGYIISDWVSGGGRKHVRFYVRGISERYNSGLLIQSKWVSDGTATNDAVKSRMMVEYEYYLKQGWYNENHNRNDALLYVEEVYGPYDPQKHVTKTGKVLRDNFIADVIIDILDSWGMSYLPAIVETVQDENRATDLMNYYNNIYGNNQIPKLRRHKSYNRLRNDTITNMVNTFDVEFFDKWDFYLMIPRAYNDDSYRRFYQSAVLTRDRATIDEAFRVYGKKENKYVYMKIDEYLNGVKWGRD